MLLNIALLLAGSYGVLLLLLFVFQAKLVYYPQVGRELATTPLAAGLAFEDVWLDPEPGVRVHGWYVPRSQARGAVLFLHGNAGNIAHRIDWLEMFHALGYATLMIDYRGYGRSTGSPSEAGTYADARAAWEHLTRQRGWSAQQLVLAGESLGGAVAAHLASRTTPRALVLQSTFTSVPDLAADLYAYMPVRWISRFRYDTKGHLAQIKVPVLIAHSRGDELIGFAHGQALYAAARAPKRFIELNGGHNDAALFMRAQWVRELGAFLDATGEPVPPRP